MIPGSHIPYKNLRGREKNDVGIDLNNFSFMLHLMLLLLLLLIMCVFFFNKKLVFEALWDSCHLLISQILMARAALCSMEAAEWANVGNKNHGITLLCRHSVSRSKGWGTAGLVWLRRLHICHVSWCPSCFCFTPLNQFLVCRNQEYIILFSNLDPWSKKAIFNLFFAMILLKNMFPWATCSHKLIKIRSEAIYTTDLYVFIWS